MARAHIELASALSAERVAGAQVYLPDGVIKSAGRALQILQLFDLLQRESTVVEIAELLKFPQSSTSMLLRSLVRMGYLHHDLHARTFIPTMSVTLLGNWIDHSVVGDGDLLLLMKRLNQETGQAILLASRSGLFARYIHVIQATAAARLYIVKGSLRSLTRSGVGHVLLSQMSDLMARRLAMRINAEAESDPEKVDVTALLNDLRKVREQGYAISTNQVTMNAGVLAMRLPGPGDGDSPLVIGVGGSAEVVRAHEADFVATMRNAIEEYNRFIILNRPSKVA
ncbi:IclR family transcriptional regulator [Sphingosinicella microcystinivorans]|uniref:IclR family transcriptional regulator n=1 Tax=Sphingosinicella microcystinivorans TaxID=335406 RepID=UPI0022F39E9A|nr:helix-turn-helix domain-containing protein [Sphingosinicella microcystinivorans]WBX83775.1 helix-turn-helix domain-containing protein [Sphingosinicella microcystinivorans]